MGGGLRDALNALQEVLQDLLGIDERALRVCVVVHRVGATNLIRRVRVAGDEGTGIPLLLLDPVSVRALVELRANPLDCHLLAEPTCGAAPAGTPELAA